VLFEYGLDLLERLMTGIDVMRSRRGFESLAFQLAYNKVKAMKNAK